MTMSAGYALPCDAVNNGMYADPQHNKLNKGFLKAEGIMPCVQHCNK